MLVFLFCLKEYIAFVVDVMPGHLSYCPFITFIAMQDLVTNLLKIDFSCLWGFQEPSAIGGDIYICNSCTQPLSTYIPRVNEIWT